MPARQPPHPPPCPPAQSRWRTLPAALGLGLAACALPPPAPAANCAMLLSTAADWPAAAASTTALSAELARRTGLAVTILRPLGPRLFAVALTAPDDVACARARAALAADKTFATAAEPDLRRSLPPRPAASASR